MSDYNEIMRWVEIFKSQIGDATETLSDITMSKHGSIEALTKEYRVKLRIALMELMTMQDEL